MDYPLYNPTTKSSSSSSSTQIMNSSSTSSSYSRKLNTTSNYGKKKGYKGGVKLSTDPQSVAARERRHKISDRFKILQSLVPGGAKLDTVSMLEHTIEYVKFLKSQIWLHQAILNNNNNINNNNYNNNNNSYYTYNQYDQNNYNNYSNNFNKYEPQYSHEMMWYDNSNYDLFCRQEVGGGLGGGNSGFYGPEANVMGVAPQATPTVNVQGSSYSYHGNDVDQMMYYKRSLEY